MSVQPDAADARARRARLEALLRERLRTSCTRLGLTHGQKALWLLNRLTPHSAAYNTGIAVRITGTVNPDHLQRALDRLVLRHEALRTTFEREDGVPVQCVWGVHDVALQRIDATGADDDRLRDMAVASYRRPFDLERGPIVRLDLFSVDSARHVLLLAVHHIVCDAWSLWILLDELLQLYRAECGGERLPLRDVTPYSGFIRWQAEWLASEDGERQAGYWEAALRAPLPVLQLPLDRVRPQAPLAEGASLDFAVDEHTARGLRELARSEGTTLYAVCLASFQLLLRNLTGQDEIVIGTLTSGRTQAAFADTVGYFVNPVVIRTRLDAQQSFRSAWHGVRDQVLAALDHQEYPFPLLVERVRPRRESGQSPLFQVLYVQQKPQAARAPSAIVGHSTAAGDALRLEPFPFPQMEGQFDLALEMTDADPLAGVWRYRTALFEPATIERFSKLFEQLLRAIVGAPDAALGNLAALPSEEAAALARFNATDVAFPQRCVHELIAAQAERTPDAIAVTFEGRSCTYSEIDQRASALAERLRACGAGPEVLVGIGLRRSVDLVVSILAVLKAGAAYVPLDPDYPRDRLTFMLDDAQVAVLITEDGVQPRRVPRSATSAAVTLDNLAYMIYTSGSTGQPKAAMNTHRGLCNRLMWMQDTYRLDRSDAVLQKTPFSFDVSVWEFLWPLMAGARLVVSRPGGHQDPQYLATLMREQEITTLHFVPSMLRVFLEQPRLGAFPRLRRVICSGEALPPDLAQRALAMLSVDVHNLYGPTEASIDVTSCSCRSSADATTVPIGRPIANTRIHIVDRGFNPCPVGVAGELCIAGMNVGRGYFGRPDQTADRFVADPFGTPGTRMYRTGDLARWRPDGDILYLGRLDTQVKIRGHRIELGEIESRLAEHEAIRAVAVIARVEGDGSTRLVAYGVARNEPPSTGELRRFLGQTLPDYMVPSLFTWLSALPLSPNGKLDRQALPVPSSERAHLDIAFVPPSTAAEQRIADVWRSVLHVERVGIHDNFFELGGTSIMLAQVHARLQQEGCPDLTIVDLFQYPTVHLVARHLAARGATEGAGSEESRASLRDARAPLLNQQRQSRLQHRQQERPRT